MNPTWRGVPEVLGRLDGLTLLLPLLLLLLLLCPHASRGEWAGDPARLGEPLGCVGRAGSVSVTTEKSGDLVR